MYEIQTIEVPSKGITLTKNGKKVFEVLNVGATLNYLSFDEHNIIDGYDEKELERFEWSKSALLFPFPNRLRGGTYMFEGSTYQFPINEPQNQNAIHGFVYDRPFKLVNQELSDSSCMIRLNLSYAGELPYYPFPFDMWVTYSLQANELEFSMEVINTGQANLPYGFGWHPYFTFGKPLDSIEMKLPIMQQIMLDERQLPTGLFSDYDHFQQKQRIKEESFDTGYKVSDDQYKVSLAIDPQKKIEIEVENFSYLQLFTPDDRKRIAVEPMSCGIDVFNTGEGLKVLSSGSKDVFKTRISNISR